jgi:hypothetical protein
MEKGPVLMIHVMSRQYARQLVGQVLHLPAIPGMTPRRKMHLKIIQIVIDDADPNRVVIHGIRVESSGREFEGRTVLLTPIGIDQFLAIPHPRRRWQRSSPPSTPFRSRTR